MAFATYNDLVTSVLAWLNRETDLDLPARVPDWIALGEARIRRRQRWYTQLYSLANSGNPLTVTTQPVVLPDHVAQIEAMWASTAIYKGDIEVITPDAWRHFIASNRDTQGIPQKAVIVPQMDNWMTDPDGTGPTVRAGGNVFLWPRPATDGSFAIDFKYIRDPDPLTTLSVNGLYVRHPDLYLYATLCESAPYLQHDERLPLWEGRFSQAVDEINAEREHAEYSASSKGVTLPYCLG